MYHVFQLSRTYLVVLLSRVRPEFLVSRVYPVLRLIRDHPEFMLFNYRIYTVFL